MYLVALFSSSPRCPLCLSIDLTFLVLLIAVVVCINVWFAFSLHFKPFFSLLIFPLPLVLSTMFSQVAAFRGDGRGGARDNEEEEKCTTNRYRSTDTRDGNEGEENSTLPDHHLNQGVEGVVGHAYCDHICTRPSTVTPCTSAYLTLGPAFWLSMETTCKIHILVGISPFLLHFARAKSTTLLQKTPPLVQMTSCFCAKPKLTGGDIVRDELPNGDPLSQAGMLCLTSAKCDDLEGQGANPPGSPPGNFCMP